MAGVTCDGTCQSDTTITQWALLSAYRSVAILPKQKKMEAPVVCSFHSPDVLDSEAMRLSVQVLDSGEPFVYPEDDVRPVLQGRAVIHVEQRFVLRG